MESVVNVLRPKRRFIIVCAILTALAGAGLSFIAPLKYSASVRLLITQRAAFTLDPYTAIRSTELISENLAQVIKTSSFLERVLKSGYQVDDRYFSGSEQSRRRLWSNTIEAAPVRGTGLLRVAVFHPRKDEALKIVSAISFLLSTQGSEYIGRDITVHLLDSPLASRYPVKPNIPLNAISGAAVGFVLGSSWVWIEHRRKKHHGELVG